MSRVTVRLHGAFLAGALHRGVGLFGGGRLTPAGRPSGKATRTDEGVIAGHLDVGIVPTISAFARRVVVGHVGLAPPCPGAMHIAGQR